MWETIRGYLTFTRKERFGVLFLLLVISILFILPYFFKPSAGDPDPEAYEKMKEGIRNFESRFRDSSREAVPHDRYPFRNPEVTNTNSGSSARSSLAEMFYFDPNTIHADEWQRLGLPDRLIRTILHYVEKGGRFRTAEDLKKLYGLRSADYQRILPYVRIAKNDGRFPARPGYVTTAGYGKPEVKKADSFVNTLPARIYSGSEYSKPGKKLEITDINRADSADWSRLPGIGEKLASRIVHFREKLGGFYQVDQVGETFGLPDSTFRKIKPVLRLNPGSWIQFDLNNAPKEMLQAHPYIRWQIAKGITEYRQQHGRFQSVGELLQLAQVDPETFEKLKPYLVVKP